MPCATFSCSGGYGFFSSPQRGSNKAGPGRRLRGPSLEVSMDAFDDLKCIVAERFEISVETLHAETDLVEDLGADSLDIVDLLMAVEERLGVSIDDDEAVGLKTLGDAAALLRAKLAA